MSPFERILLAVDLDPRGQGLSSGSRRATDQALALAKRSDASVRLFHSTAGDERWDPEQGDYRVTPPGLRERGGSVLEAVEAEFRDQAIPVETLLSEDPAWLGIIRRVLREPIDLVISGKRNETERPGPRIGSVAMKLLRKCPCPTWVVKPGAETRPRSILAATDLTPVGSHVVFLAARAAELFEAGLHVVHAFQLPLDVQMKGDPAAFESSEHHRRQAELQQTVLETGFPGETSYHVGLTSPTQAILACEDRLNPDLVVMGTLSRSGVAGLLVGNTAERLLGRLDCSLLTVKPDGFVCPVV